MKVKLRTVRFNPRKNTNRQRVESGGAVKNNSEGNWMNLLLVLFYQNQLDFFNWQRLQVFLAAWLQLRLFQPRPLRLGLEPFKVDLS